MNDMGHGLEAPNGSLNFYRNPRNHTCDDDNHLVVFAYTLSDDRAGQISVCLGDPWTASPLLRLTETQAVGLAAALTGAVDAINLHRLHPDSDRNHRAHQDVEDVSHTSKT